MLFFYYALRGLHEIIICPRLKPIEVSRQKIKISDTVYKSSFLASFEYSSRSVTITPSFNFRRGLIGVN